MTKNGKRELLEAIRPATCEPARQRRNAFWMSSWLPQGIIASMPSACYVTTHLANQLGRGSASGSTPPRWCVR